MQLKRAQPANALVVGQDVYLFDAGEGTQRQMKAAGLRLAQVKAIILSHHHLDHVGGLGPILMNRWVQGLHSPIPVIGPRGTNIMVRGLIASLEPVVAAPLVVGGPDKPALATSVNAREIVDAARTPSVIYRDGNIEVHALENDHYHYTADKGPTVRPESYSFRVAAEGRVIVYSGDTGPSKRLEGLARGADVLVSEVIDREAVALALKKIPSLEREGLGPHLEHMRLDHMSPDEVGALAHAAGVKQLVLTHLGPGLDEDRSAEGYVRGASKTFRGPVVVANDLDRF